MSKLMILTVGTSLFHSASWDENNVNFLNELGSSADDYKRVWVDRGPNKNGPLYSPDDRKSKCPELVRTLKGKLESNNASVWKDYVADYTPSTPEMRYSAELATMLSYFKQEYLDWHKELENYEITLVCDSNENNESNIAACHLKYQLLKLLSVTDERVRVENIRYFSNTEPRYLAEGLRLYQQFTKDQLDSGKYKKLDIVVSGGFKIYGLISYGFLFSDRVKIIYQHEMANVIYQQTKEQGKLVNHVFPFDAILS